jgi:alpha-mannosidase
VPVSAAAEVDLLEESDRALEIADNAVRLDFRPFEIKTIKLQIRAAAKT